ncbi:MAG: hypothetical protein WC683_01970 [bacterium]
MFKTMRGSLLFPELVRDGEAGAGRLEGRPVYRLDWAARDARLRERHEAWCRQYHPDLDLPWVPALDEAWTAWMDGLRFALDEAYLGEIRRTTRAALDEWGMARFFDTMVRDICLRPAVSFVWGAFFLLGDCSYDPEEAYFARDDRRGIFRYAAPYRFWHGQTGSGMLRRNARFDDMGQWMVGKAAGGEGRMREEDAFRSMIDAQERRREEIMAACWKANPSAEAPVLV